MVRVVSELEKQVIDRPTLEVEARRTLALYDLSHGQGIVYHDFLRLVTREPFCGLLPPDVLEDVYWLVSMGGTILDPMDLKSQKTASGQWFLENPKGEVQPARAASPPPLSPPPPMATGALGATKTTREVLRVMNRGRGDQGMVREIFDRFDTDGNGAIDSQEFIPFAQEVRGPCRLSTS